MQILKRASKMSKVEVSDDMDISGSKIEDTMELYGNWQLEPLCLPRAVNGIVPKVCFHYIYPIEQVQIIK